MLTSIPERKLSTRAEAAGQLRCLRGQLEDIACLVAGQAPGPQVLGRIDAAQATLHRIQRGLVQQHLKACLQLLLRQQAQVLGEAATRQILADIRELYGAHRGCAVLAPMMHESARKGAVERGDE